MKRLFVLIASLLLPSIAWGAITAEYAESGAISDEQFTRISLSVTYAVSGGTVEFDYDISSESGFDFLIVRRGSTSIFSTSGVSAVNGQSVAVGATGTLTIAFEYEKDSSDASGRDGVRVDNIIFRDGDGTVLASYDWTGEPSGSVPSPWVSESGVKNMSPDNLKPMWSIVDPGNFPTYVASGTFTNNAAACTAPMPGGITTGDFLLLIVETENQAISLTTANGFTELSVSPQSAGTAATNPGHRLAAFYKVATASNSSPITNDSGDHQTCQIHAFRGQRTSPNPWDVLAGGNDSAANDTSATIPGLTTTIDETLVILVQGTSNNATSSTNCGTATNANLTEITERTDSTNTIGLGGGHCLITGKRAVAGVVANTTLTLSATSFKGAYSIALAPPDSTPPASCENFVALTGAGCQ